ncbi:MAG: hypothetical protein MUE90_00795 [Thermoanaerobaculales bacterium]|nr:hypothetical protein [Thermoanaerobaculales bacterium]
MGVLALVLASATAASPLAADELQWFPGDYFDRYARASLQRQVLSGWPGPTALLQLWRSGALAEDERLGVLLGGAAFHDPVLLPLYREAVGSPSQRLRQAAAYGYRDLIADRLPDVRGGVDASAAEALDEEMAWVASTLRRRSLVELWLQSALAHGGASLPGWDAVTLQRTPADCLLAVEKVVDVGDLDLLAGGYRLAADRGLRIGLLKLIESLSLSRFIVIPEGGHHGWGPQVYEQAFAGLDAALQRWARGGCAVDGVAVQRERLAAMGAAGVEPMGPEACVLWVNVLDKGDPQWGLPAARRLYACGGPFLELSALDAGSERNAAQRRELLRWFRPLTAAGAPRPAAR